MCRWFGFGFVSHFGSFGESFVVLEKHCIVVLHFDEPVEFPDDGMEIILGKEKPMLSNEPPDKSVFFAENCFGERRNNQELTVFALPIRPFFFQDIRISYDGLVNDRTFPRIQVGVFFRKYDYFEVDFLGF